MLNLGGRILIIIVLNLVRRILPVSHGRTYGCAPVRPIAAPDRCGRSGGFERAYRAAGGRRCCRREMIVVQRRCSTSAEQSMLASLLLVTRLTAAATASAPPGLSLVDNISYASFLGRLDPVWKWSSNRSAPPPDNWWNMAFTGNGMLASMITAGANASKSGDLGTLQLEIGRSDVTDDRMPG
eukprot:SAG31_NODE_3023_length_4780_cov_5.085665_6_plen_183_part_00